MANPVPQISVGDVIGSAGAGLAGFSQFAQGLESLFAHNHAEQYYKDMADKNVAMQKEFAQNGIRWRVEDAKRAGINPVVALGGSGASFSPVSVGDVGGYSDPLDGLANMGQGIARAVRATQTATERQDSQLQQLTLERAKLENSLLGVRIAKEQQAMLNPPMPEERPLQSDMAFTKTKRGGLAPVPSEAFADRAEDQVLPQIAWGARNLFNPPNPNRPPPPGHEWIWNPFRFEFEAMKSVKGNSRKDVPWWKAASEVYRRYYNSKKGK